MRVRDDGQKREKKWSLGDILVNTRLVRDNELLPAVKTVCLLVVVFFSFLFFTFQIYLLPIDFYTMIMNISTSAEDISRCSTR